MSDREILTSGPINLWEHNKGKINRNFLYLYGYTYPYAQIGDVAGGNYCDIQADGSVVLNGTATVIDDVVGQLDFGKIAGASGKATFNATEGAVAFAPSGAIATDADCVMLTLQIPHAAKADAPLTLHIHWEQTDATARTFVYRYRVRNNGAAKPAWSSDVTVSTGTAGVNVYTYTAGSLEQISRLGSIALTGTGVSAMVQIRLTRTDAVAGAIYATFIDGHVERSSGGGSRQEYIR